MRGIAGRIGGMLMMAALVGALPAATEADAQGRRSGRVADRATAERIAEAREEANRRAAERAEARRLEAARIAARADSLRAERARMEATRAAVRAEPPSAAATATVRAEPSSAAATAAAITTGAAATGPALEGSRYTVLIDLDENHLYFRQGEVTLWSAPVGTGTGMRVITKDEDWEFSTPTGRFQVQYKERDPVWIAPDWYFVENNLPIPAPNHPSRYMRGTLGVAAVYLSPHVAIHGTNRPELIGQRVSHGCIRLENRYALRLYHNVQVGTEVVIVGGEEARRGARTVDLRTGYDPSLASTGGGKDAPVDPVIESWKKMSTAALTGVLDRELLQGSRSARWDEAAILLVQRANQGDDRAMEEILGRTVKVASDRMRREWATYVAYLYRNEPKRTLAAMSGLSASDRRAVARVIVTSALTLYAGDLNAPSAPWPTKRLPEEAVPAAGRSGWTALVTAEREQREAIEATAGRGRV